MKRRKHFYLFILKKVWKILSWMLQRRCGINETTWTDIKRCVRTMSAKSNIDSHDFHISLDSSFLRRRLHAWKRCHAADKGFGIWWAMQVGTLRTIHAIAKKDLFFSKLLLGVLAIASGAAIQTAGALLTGKTALLHSIPLSSLGALIYLCTSLPLMFHLGLEKGRIFLMLLSAGLLAFSGLFLT